MPCRLIGWQDKLIFWQVLHVRLLISLVSLTNPR